MEIKHYKSHQDLKYAQFKRKKQKKLIIFIKCIWNIYFVLDEEFSKEIDATKSILFKTHFKRLNEIFVRENEADRVLFSAMKVNNK